MNNDDGEPEDIIPEELAIRRGMVYSKDARGKVCRAEMEAPLLVDQLYNHEIIASEHHFYAIQFITMRKVFLAPVGFKIGMLMVKRDQEQAQEKPIPMEDTDYLRVLRAVKSVTHQRLLREICDEAADPYLHHVYGRQKHTVMTAFDALCEAVQRIWEEKSRARENE